MYDGTSLTAPSSAPGALFVGSYPPRECGIATFTRDVVESYDRVYGTTSAVFAIDEPGGESRSHERRVIARLQQNDRSSYKRAARIANAHPAAVVNVQHEYGLFGGTDGAWFLDFLQAVEKPAVVSLHTVLPDPSASHREVTRSICRRADAIVVLSQTGKEILIDAYGADPSKTHVIHHGVPDVPFRSTDVAKAAFGVGQRTVISTFGLLSRGKGLEYAIDAMRLIVERHPDALYLILGETHPGVRRHEGESYRESLVAKVAQLGLQSHVALVDKYLEFEELMNYLGATDIYVTPYLNPVQIVSGTLAYAMGAGKAIVSTPYLYAKELLADHRGFLAPFRNARVLAEKVLAFLDDPWLRRATERRAYRFGRQMTWPRVANAYGRLFEEVLPAPLYAPSAFVQPA